MKVHISSRKKEYEALGEFDISTRELMIFKGAKVSKDIANSKTFKGARTIERMRESVVSNNVLQEDKKFKSPSTAANFVTGRSTNGLIAWKTEDGIKLKDIIKK